MKISEGKLKWEAFRSEVIKLDGYKCVKCGRTEAEGVTLQVHHLKYRYGVKLWEYSHDECETLCKGCHAELHGKILPKSDWQLEFDEDLEDIEGKCDLCGTSLRYVFHISHSKWPEMIKVGTHCCDNLTGTDLASVFMESKIKYDAKLNRFINSPRWAVDDSGNRHFLKRRGRAIVVQKNPNCTYKVRIDKCNGVKEYLSLEEAKRKTFEVLENGKYDEYLAKKNIK